MQNDKQRIQLRSVNGELKFTNSPEEAIKLISSSNYWKVSYTDDHGNQYRWEKTVKGEMEYDTKLYSDIQEYSQARTGAVFWANKPLQLLGEIVRANVTASDVTINILFDKECKKRWKLTSHDEFCKLLMRIN